MVQSNAFQTNQECRVKFWVDWSWPLNQCYSPVCWGKFIKKMPWNILMCARRGGRKGSSLPWVEHFCHARLFCTELSTVWWTLKSYSARFRTLLNCLVLNHLVSSQVGRVLLKADLFFSPASGEQGQYTPCWNSRNHFIQVLIYFRSFRWSELSALNSAVLLAACLVCVW